MTIKEAISHPWIENTDALDFSSSDNKKLSFEVFANTEEYN